MRNELTSAAQRRQRLTLLGLRLHARTIQCSMQSPYGHQPPSLYPAPASNHTPCSHGNPTAPPTISTSYAVSNRLKSMYVGRSQPLKPSDDTLPGYISKSANLPSMMIQPLRSYSQHRTNSCPGAPSIYRRLRGITSAARPPLPTSCNTLPLRPLPLNSTTKPHRPTPS